MACRIKRPIVRDRRIDIANDIRKTLAIGTGRSPYPRDRAVTEIGEITEGCPHPLNPCRLINETRRHRRRQVIGIANAIITDKAVLAKKLVVGKVVTLGIEKGNIFLVRLRDIDIEQTRLKGLLNRLIPEQKFVVEVGSRVER